ncbi:MAG: glycosyl hydrolase family 28 protein [Verrucomicrobiota bacterium]
MIRAQSICSWLIALCVTSCLQVHATVESRVFDAAVYGAKPDGLTVSTTFIQRAIDAASGAGGGVVTFPRGTFMTGALFLKSNVELRLDDGVMLRAIPDDAAFPQIPSRSAGIEMMWPAALINAIGQTNVKLTGKGVLDGNGKFWWLKYWGEDRKGGSVLDYEKRGIGWALSWDCTRPQLILFKDCEDVQVKDLTLLRSPFWTVQLTYCARVTVDGVTIRNNIGGYGPSTDGIDVDSSRDVLIQNCDIECNDDNICLKSGRDADGLRVNRPTENVVIRNCITRDGHGMFTLGTETSGGIHNVEAYNIRAFGTTSGIRLKGRLPRGGVVENINIHDIVMNNVKNPIAIDLNVEQKYPVPAGMSAADLPPHWKTLTRKVEPAERAIPEFRNITVSNTYATGADVAFSVRGNVAKAIHGVRLSNVTIEAAKAGSIQYAADWKMESVTVRAADNKKVELIDCRRVASPRVVKAGKADIKAELSDLRLEVISEHRGPLIAPGYPGTEGNQSGFETGFVVMQDGVCHMFINEMFGMPHRELRIAHWLSADGENWKRQGTVFESIPGRAPSNLRAEVWVNGMAFDELENRWNMFYVAYRGGDGARGEIAGSDYEGKIWRAASVVTGRSGISGPYRDVDIIMRPDEHSLPWEGQQGVDSFFPYQVGEQWYGFYGSHNHLPRGPWLVGLAKAPSLAGPWQRMPKQSPTPIVKTFTENPVVQEILPNRWLALYDSDSPYAVGYSVSADGVNWTPEKRLIVQGEGQHWVGDNGLWDVRTPLGLLPQADDTFTLLYTAKLKSQSFWAVGKCTVKLSFGNSSPRVATAAASSGTSVAP